MAAAQSSEIYQMESLKIPTPQSRKTRSKPRPQRKSKIQWRSRSRKTVWRRPPEWQLCQIPTKSADLLTGRDNTITAAALKQ